VREAAEGHFAWRIVFGDGLRGIEGV
jgi:hypothetical protein